MPITRTLLKAGTVPKDELTVDVSARTLTSDVVVPAMGVVVGAIVSFDGISVIGVAVNAIVAGTGNVAVTNSGTVTVDVDKDASHPVHKRMMIKKALECLRFTG